VFSCFRGFVLAFLRVFVVRGFRSLLVALLGAAAFSSLSCKPASEPKREATTVWRNLGTWSGRGFLQTGPFIGDTGSIRLNWETRNETPPGTGTFKVTLHSDVSGRSLLVAVDRKGVGKDTTYITEDPRAFFLVIEGHNLDWTLTAEEGIPATAAPLG
jgi:hypothetical protein